MGVKAQMGYVVRGVAGFLQTAFYRAPVIPQDWIEVIGRSVEGRPIECVRFGTGAIPVLFAAGIHGNEVGTVRFAYELIHWAAAHEKDFPHLSVYVIPCINPDGYARALAQPDYFHGGRIGRFNAHDVDLNRNFATPSFARESGWLFGAAYSKKRTVYCGEQGNSEPETQALTAYIQRQGIRTVFIYHNVAADISASTDATAQRIAGVYATATGFPLYTEAEWQQFGLTGTAKEWCEQEGISYIEIESSTRWGSDWNRQKRAVEAMLSVDTGLFSR